MQWPEERLAVDAGPKSEKLIQLCRVLSHLLQDPRQDLSAEGLAKRLDLKPDTVRWVLGSDEFRGMLQRVTEDTNMKLVSLAMTKLFAAVQEADPLRDWEKIRRILDSSVKAHVALSKSDKGAAEKESAIQVVEVLKKIKEAKFRVKQVKEDVDRQVASRPGQDHGDRPASPERELDDPSSAHV